MVLCQSYKTDCCLTNSDAHVTGGSEDGHIYFWDLVDASVVLKFKAHSSVVKLVLLLISCSVVFINILFIIPDIYYSNHYDL